jgi:hypothetical protein
MKDHAVTTTTGKDIPVKATTVCVHSDTPSAVAISTASPPSPSVALRFISVDWAFLEIVFRSPPAPLAAIHV